jgi:hypothetical protein
MRNIRGFRTELMKTVFLYVALDKLTVEQRHAGIV